MLEKLYWFRAFLIEDSQVNLVWNVQDVFHWVFLEAEGLSWH